MLSGTENLQLIQCSFKSSCTSFYGCEAVVCSVMLIVADQLYELLGAVQNFLEAHSNSKISTDSESFSTVPLKISLDLTIEISHESNIYVRCIFY